MKKVRIAGLGMAVCVAVLCTGANTSYSTSPKKDVLERLEELEKQNAALTQQVNDLKTRVELLTERVNTLYARLPSGNVAGGPAAGSSGGNAGVPGDLEVVRLSPEPNQRTGPASPPPSNRPRGRVIVIDSNNPTAANSDPAQPLPGTNYVPLPDPETTMAPPPAGERSPSGPKPTGSPPPMASPSSPASARDEASLFQEIKKLVQENRRAEAVPLMETYLKQFPKGPHMDAVAYWLGEEKFARGDYEAAIKSYRLVTENRPESNYAPEALYKIGLALLELSRRDEAAEVLEEVKILYPFSEAAVKAEQKLASCCR